MWTARVGTSGARGATGMLVRTPRELPARSTARTLMAPGGRRREVDRERAVGGDVHRGVVHGHRQRLVHRPVRVTGAPRTAGRVGPVISMRGRTRSTVNVQSRCGPAGAEGLVDGEREAVRAVGEVAGAVGERAVGDVRLVEHVGCRRTRASAVSIRLGRSAAMRNAGPRWPRRRGAASWRRGPWSPAAGRRRAARTRTGRRRPGPRRRPDRDFSQGLAGRAAARRPRPGAQRSSAQGRALLAALAWRARARGGRSCGHRRRGYPSPARRTTPAGRRRGRQAADSTRSRPAPLAR